MKYLISLFPRSGKEERGVKCHHSLATLENLTEIEDWKSLNRASQAQVSSAYPALFRIQRDRFTLKINQTEMYIKRRV